MKAHYPVSSKISTPALQSEKCRQCGNAIEIFSNEIKAVCINCGYIIFKDAGRKYARE